jgi:hypothetical protein
MTNALTTAGSQDPGPDFIPIISSQVSWADFLKSAQLALRRSVSASLDAKGLPAAGLAPFIGAVAEFAKIKSDPIEALRSDELALRHAHLGFLISLDRTLFIYMASRNLTVSAAPQMDFAVVSGTLAQWQSAVTCLCKRYVPRELRLLMCKLIMWFERNDLGEMFGHYAKQPLNDGTFSLEQKPR